MTAHQRRLLVPLYVHPAADPHPWRVLERAAWRLYGFILNLADGPGIRPDPVFAGAAGRLCAVLTDVRRHRR